MIDACEFMNLESKECAYTRSNNRKGEELVIERLERALCTIDWSVTFPNVEEFALLIVGSNHNPILLHFFFFQKEVDVKDF